MAKRRCGGNNEDRQRLHKDGWAMSKNGEYGEANALPWPAEGHRLLPSHIGFPRATGKPLSSRLTLSQTAHCLAISPSRARPSPELPSSTYLQCCQPPQRVSLVAAQGEEERDPRNSARGDQQGLTFKTLPCAAAALAETYRHAPYQRAPFLSAAYVHCSGLAQKHGELD